MTKDQKKNLKDLPSVTEALKHKGTIALIDELGRPLVTHAIRQAIDFYRKSALKGGKIPGPDGVAKKVRGIATELYDGTLTSVINGTGVVLHTNMSRAPLGNEVIEEIGKIASGYSNLEYNLAANKRGNRHVHVRKALRFLTGAEDVVVVNNNAAALVLVLNSLAEGKEVLISRGELIEIGGAFRIPDIMAASGAKMVEVGTTNRTRASDYEEAITENTALIFKAHQSNFSMHGFIEEVSVGELTKLAHKHGLPMMYDLGSGLLVKPEGLPLESEPDVRGCIETGADIVSFSGDKLLGGPQAGIIAGKREFVLKVAKAPLMRAFRVCKLTYAALSVVCRQYFKEEELLAKNPTFAMLNRGKGDLEKLATRLEEALKARNVSCRLIESVGQCGGGTLPDLRIPSFAVEILPVEGIGSGKVTFAEALFERLVQTETPVLGVLREGKFLFDVLTLFEDQIPVVADAVQTVLAPGGK